MYIITECLKNNFENQLSCRSSGFEFLMSSQIQKLVITFLIIL